MAELAPSHNKGAKAYVNGDYRRPEIAIIAYPVEKKGRFVPASKKQWLQTFTIDGSQLSGR